MSRPFTASVKPRGERRKSLGSYATAVEAALARAMAVAKYDAENPQPAQPASGGRRGAKQKQKRRKRSEDGFDRVTTADVIRMEEEEGYVSESDEESDEEESDEGVRVPEAGDLLEVEVEEDGATGWRTGKVVEAKGRRRFAVCLVGDGEDASTFLETYHMREHAKEWRWPGECEEEVEVEAEAVSDSEDGITVEEEQPPAASVGAHRGGEGGRGSGGGGGARRGRGRGGGVSATASRRGPSPPPPPTPATKRHKPSHNARPLPIRQEWVVEVPEGGGEPRWMVRDGLEATYD